MKRQLRRSPRGSAPRAIDPPQEAAQEVSRNEQAALGRGMGTGATALQPSVVIGLQRTAGNAAVTSLVQRSQATTEGEETEDQGPSSPVRDIVGKGRGRPLDSDLRNEMEARLGTDFSDVRIHTDAEASQSAAAVSARAYTVGHEVVFGADAPPLDSAPGKRTLAHELTHVVQQRSGPVAGTPTGDGISISDPSDTFERAAEANADRVMSGQRGDGQAAHQGAGGVGLVPAQRVMPQAGEEEPVQGIWLQRDEDEEEDQETEQAVQGIWLQRDPTDTDLQDEDEDEDEEEDQETEQAVQGIWLQRDPTDTDLQDEDEDGLS